MNKILGGLSDLVVSGINIGPNLGIDDLLTSGTLGATFEAAIRGVPAIAVSYCLSELTDKMHVLEHGMPEDVDIVSINVAENAECNNVKLTSLCYDGYGDIHREAEGGYKIKSWSLRHYPDGTPGTDLHAIKNGKCISVTPLKVEFFHNKDAMKDLLDALVD